MYRYCVSKIEVARHSEYMHGYTCLHRSPFHEPFV